VVPSVLVVWQGMSGAGEDRYKNLEIERSCISLITKRTQE